MLGIGGGWCSRCLCLQSYRGPLLGIVYETKALESRKILGLNGSEISGEQLKER